MYHGTVSGSFKNALDWLQLLSDRDPPFLTTKVEGLIGTAGGVQGLQAVNTMEFAVRALRGWAVPLVIPVARVWEAFDAGLFTTSRTIALRLWIISTAPGCSTGMFVPVWGNKSRRSGGARWRQPGTSGK